MERLLQLQMENRELRYELDRYKWQANIMSVLAAIGWVLTVILLFMLPA